MICSGIFNLFKPEECFPIQITDPIVIKKEYKYWRFRIFYSIYAGYIFYYLTRKTLIFSAPLLMLDLKITQADIGSLASTLTMTYGISKFTSGILSDRANPRFFMAIGLLLTGVCNILFGCCSSLLWFGILWALNGYFQGWGWPACTKQLTHWFGNQERGTWWSICATSDPIGSFLAALLAAWCGQKYGWRFTMILSGTLSLIVGFWLMNRLRDIPQSLGLPPIELFKNEKKSVEKNSSELPSVRTILLKYILNNPDIWVLVLAAFFIYIMAQSIDNWYYLYLIKAKGYTTISASAFIGTFEISNLFGILMAGWASDYWFHGNRIPIIILCSFGLIFSFVGIWCFSPDYIVLFFMLSGLMGFFMSALPMLVGLAAAEFVTKKAASTSNGFVGCFAYLGASIGGYPLIKFIELYGWRAFIMALVFCSGCIIVVLFPIYNRKKCILISSHTRHENQNNTELSE